MTCRVAVVGSSNLDVMLRTPRLPKPGETLLGHACQLGSGGKGANQAVMAARLGSAVTLVSRVGRDAFGADLLRSYQAEGLDMRHVTEDEQASTGLAVITVDDAAENSIIVIPGANARLSPADVAAADVALSGCRVVLGQFEVPQTTTRAAFELVRRAGGVTILNPAPARPLDVALLAATNHLVLNESELELLTGQALMDEAAMIDAARKMLRTPGPRAILLTRGAAGVLLIELADHQAFLAPRVQAVDTTGAGDAFVGSLGVAVAEGRTLRDAIPFAMAAAALSVTKLGTQSSYPRRAEVEQLLRDVFHPLPVGDRGRG
jgi:ribokinase